MKDALINMVLLFAIDVALIAVVSWVVILFMESGLRQRWKNAKEELSTYLCRFKDTLRDDWKYEKVGCLVLSIAIIGLLVIPCMLAYYIPFEKIACWNIFEKFINEHALYTSIMGTFIGIVIIFCLMRPRMRIEKKLMTLDTEKKEKHLKVRVRNLGLFPINNVDVQLLFYRMAIEDGKKIKKTKKLELLRADSPVLRGIFPSEADPTYGCATELTIDELEEARKLKRDSNQVYEGILCRVRATHAISGVTYVREHMFGKEELDEFLAKYGGRRRDDENPALTACKKINKDIVEMGKQMKDIKDGIRIIQKESENMHNKK